MSGQCTRAHQTWLISWSSTMNLAMVIGGRERELHRRSPVKRRKWPSLSVLNPVWMLMLVLPCWCLFARKKHQLSCWNCNQSSIKLSLHTCITSWFSEKFKTYQANAFYLNSDRKFLNNLIGCILWHVYFYFWVLGRFHFLKRFKFHFKISKPCFG
jgi:hypothetical protein